MSALARASGRLGVLGWVLVGAGLAASGGLGSDHAVGHGVLLVLVLAFFGVQLARLVLLLVDDANRRGTLGVLAVAVTLWGVGATFVATTGLGAATHFPNAAQALFLGGYLALAGYLIIVAGPSGRGSVATWLNVVVICGATACVASSVLFLPVTGRTSGASVFVALLFPLLDVMFALLVLAQLVLHVRVGLRRVLPVSAAFAIFAFADTHFFTGLSSGTVTYTLLNVAAWAIGFALVVDSAAATPHAVKRPALPRSGDVVLCACITVAVVLLTLRPAGELGLYVAAPAVLTLIAAGGRLMLALHESRRDAAALVRSHTDDLTRLPNRRALRERIDIALAKGTQLGLIVLDLDGFKDINDTLGHRAGDTVLELVSGRIREAVPALASVARLGGDEFGILAPRGDYLMMRETADVVLEALREPVHIDGVDLALTASVGIVDCIVDQLMDSNELLRRAEVAMYRAKEARTGIALYDPYNDEFSKAKLRLSEDLRRGIRDGELEVWYQPQIDASSLRPCALEALVRWRHPTQGLLSPVAFLPEARRAGLMPALSQEVVRLAVADLAIWHAAGLPLRVAINCAPPELLSGVFVPRLREALSDARVPAAGIVLEVTEESFMSEPERAREILHEVRGHGIQISIDDYGTGFSSLAYLRELPADELKLDRTFVASICSDPRTRMIVTSTIQMARGLGLRTVAEGIEDAATAAELIAIGVDALQGYHISRPMPAREVVHWIVKWPTFADLRLIGHDAAEDPPGVSRLAPGAPAPSRRVPPAVA